ncbi:ADGRG6 [Acanthosepion pharaonis]|uniref:ADGRG6 n=1 Tax=Acanthosepion pharaonis TaxID=158019 RepID=A0A812AXM6_ACAPH|nr:ADGRG6 [Sepia pharaonis]
MINSPEESLVQAEQTKFSANQLLEMADSICEKMHLEKSDLSASYSNMDVGIAIAKAAKGSKNTNNFSSFGSKTSSHILQRINSQVLAATVPGVHFTNLKDPVTMRFFHLSKNATNPQCVFWQDSPSTVPHWSTEGCSVLYNVPGKLTVCECIHLTNFALLMDIYNSGDPVDPKHSKALSMLSFIGCGISFVALLITIVTYLGFRKLRSGAVSHILISLCMALAASNLIFVVGMQPYTLSEIVACKVVAVLLHYTLLASMMWMAIEAVHIYLAMVVVFRTYLSHFIIRCSVFAWDVGCHSLLSMHHSYFPFLLSFFSMSPSSASSFGASWLYRRSKNMNTTGKRFASLEL